MKINSKLSVVVGLISLFFTTSCSEETQITNEPQNSATAVLARPTPPPPTPGELRGLYDIKLNSGVEANLVFEYGNYVCYGSSTLYDMTHLPGMRTSYTEVGVQTYAFSTFDGTTTLNYRFVYDSFSTKINGTYGSGTSFTNLGTFKGKKHITGTSGTDFLKGYWLGSYSGMYDYLMVFEEDGKVTVGTGETYFSSVIGKGTYQIYGDTVIGSYTYPNGYMYSFKGTCNFAGHHITGTWGHGNSNSNGGDFSLSGQNFY